MAGPRVEVIYGKVTSGKTRLVIAEKSW